MKKQEKYKQKSRWRINKHHTFSFLEIYDGSETFADKEVELGKTKMFTLYGKDYQFFRESKYFLMLRDKLRLILGWAQVLFMIYYL